MNCDSSQRITTVATDTKIKVGHCILSDQGGVLEIWAQVGGIFDILGPGGRHIENFGPRWAVYWELRAQAVCMTPNIGSTK